MPVLQEDGHETCHEGGRCWEILMKKSRISAARRWRHLSRRTTRFLVDLAECPLLFQYLASSQKTVTDFVERALKTVAPAEYASRAASHRLELVQGLGLLGSEQIAVFVCTTAFPCVACPLFVYEPRYRLMVRRCVESGVRQFGIAACLNREATGTKR